MITIWLCIFYLIGYVASWKNEFAVFVNFLMTFSFSSVINKRAPSLGTLISVVTFLILR